MEDYNQWLLKTGVRRAVLVEAGFLDGGVADTAYIANHPYISEPADTPPNQPYDDLLSNRVSLSRRMSDTFTGKSAVTRGDISVINNGFIDDWLTYWFNDQPLKIYLGSPDWDRNDFQLIVDGVCAGVSTQRNKVTLKLGDKSQLLEKPFPRDAIAGGDNDGKLEPLCFGECFNVEPVLIDAATHKYQVHAGQIEAITEVRDGGLALTGGSAPTIDLATGTFTLNASPAARITCDTKGAKPNGTYHSNCIDLVRHILIDYAGVAPGDIDEAAMTALDTAAPYDCGLYVSSDTYTMTQAINALIGSIGGYWFFDRLGKFTVGRLDVPTGTPDYSLVPDDFKTRKLSRKKVNPPVTAVKLGYRKNGSVQTDGLLGAVTEANRDLFGRAYTLSTSEDATVINNYPDALPGPEIGTLLVNQVDADAEAARRMVLQKVPREIFEMEVFAAAFAINLANELDITYPRFDFNTGASGIVTAIADYPGQGRAVLEVWR